MSYRRVVNAYPREIVQSKAPEIIAGMTSQDFVIISSLCSTQGCCTENLSLPAHSTNVGSGISLIPIQPAQLIAVEGLIYMPSVLQNQFGEMFSSQIQSHIQFSSPENIQVKWTQLLKHSNFHNPINSYIFTFSPSICSPNWGFVNRC